MGAGGLCGIGGSFQDGPKSKRKKEDGEATVADSIGDQSFIV